MTRPVINNLPPKPSSQDVNLAFVTKADDLLASLPQFTDEVNDFESWVDSEEQSAQSRKDTVESLRDDIQDNLTQITADNSTVKSTMDSATQYLQSVVSDVTNVESKVESLVNFKGLWDNLTGSFPINSTVQYEGKYYRSLVSIADVTLSNPSTSGDWEELVGIGDTPVGVVGDILFTTDVLENDPDWLLCDGSSYLQSEYPELFALLGIGDTTNGYPFNPSTEFATPNISPITPSNTTPEGWGLSSLNVYIRTNTNTGV